MFTESPARTLTFLFTDIEGSTRRWEQWPVAMAAALARHDALVADAIAAHGGSVFKTVGDAFCAVFPDPAAALAAAIDAQQALAAENWAAFGAELPAVGVRVALHSGSAEARGGDYFGPTVNRVARLLGAGHGGQVLLSAVTAELLAHALPAGLTLRALGRHRLKDLAEPVEVFQAEAPGLVADFPPLASLDRVRHNLPHQATSFVGRTSELAELRAKLATAPLITVTGPGGTGKTRLAQQLAAECLDDFPDGIFFVDLAPLTEPSLAPAVALQALGLPSEPGRPAQDTLRDFLRRHPRLVLILDNCEHLLDGTAALAHAVLSACPEVRLVATSREPLAVAGEIVWPLAPLATPPPQSSPRPDTLAAYDAVRLFVDRAEAALPGFAVTDANAAAVAHICHRLDSIPLAIELAAARVRLFSPSELARRLDARFRLLTRGNRAALPRHQTLRACLDWSYDLLSANERRVFERLGVFAGNIPFDAAERVCAADDFVVDDVLDALIGLEAKSLLRTDRRDERSTCRLLETMRAYARERLAESGDEAPTRDRHLAWCRAAALEAEPHVDMADWPEWHARLARMNDDIEAAMDWGLSTDDLTRARQAIELALALVHYRAPGSDIHAFVARYRPAIPFVEQIGDPRLLALVYYRAEMLDQLVDRVGIELSDSPEVATVLRLGLDDLARTLALAGHYRSLGLHSEEAWILHDVGQQLIYRTGDSTTATALVEQSLAVKRGVAPAWDVAICLNILGEIYRQEGDLVQAKALFEEALRITEVVPGAAARQWSHANLAFCQIYLGEAEGAVAGATAALRAELAYGLRFHAATFLPWCACAHAFAEHGRAAARLYGAAAAAYRHFGGSLDQRISFCGILGPTDWDDIARGEALARSQLTPAAWDTAFAEGAAMSVDEALAYALAVGDGTSAP